MELLQDLDSSSITIGPHWPSSYPEYLSPYQGKDEQRRIVWARLLGQRSNLASRLSKQNERYQALRQELNPRTTQVESSHDPLYCDTEDDSGSWGICSARVVRSASTTDKLRSVLADALRMRIDLRAEGNLTIRHVFSASVVREGRTEGRTEHGMESLRLPLYRARAMCWIRLCMMTTMAATPSENRESSSPSFYFIFYFYFLKIRSSGPSSHYDCSSTSSSYDNYTFTI